MGMYAQTNYTIACKDEKTAKSVEKIIKKMNKDDKEGNNYGVDMEVLKNTVSGFMSSGRYQNLTWKCEEIWNAVKGMEGVTELSAPFLIEDEGFYQNKE